MVKPIGSPSDITEPGVGPPANGVTTTVRAGVGEGVGVFVGGGVGPGAGVFDGLGAGAGVTVGGDDGEGP